MLLSLGIMLLFGSNWIELSGAGALAVLTTAFVAAHGWTANGKVALPWLNSLIALQSRRWWSTLLLLKQSKEIKTKLQSELFLFTTKYRTTRDLASFIFTGNRKPHTTNFNPNFEKCCD